MEDWVERIHQWGIRMRRRFRTVQDPFVCAHAREKASSRCNHPDVLLKLMRRMQGTSKNYQKKRLIYYQQDEKNSAMRGGSKRWIILSMARRRDLPGRRYFFTMGRSIRSTEGKATRWNICVILRRGSERECEVCSFERPHPPSAGTTKSQRRVGTHKRPPPKKTRTSDREITYGIPRN